jgi:uncharacterized protein YyaL (SSP411 family)
MSDELNALKDSVSSYLRSAAHQPVRWSPWSEEAFTRAKEQNKPILLDIGAVWCHWCHVMDRESYESEEVARIINENFVAIKVDRDEQPDVDARYQSAISAISGQGGWPLTAFLTPEGRPFYGGTYFPPEDHFGRPGFKRVLLSVAQAFREKKAEIEDSAQRLTDALRRAEVFSGARQPFSVGVVDAIVNSAVETFDLHHGGFGRAPKFPHPAAIDLILERYQATNEKALLTVAATTLEQMARGGVYDQLGGGFHRYSVDERWIVPHFEKMSYDNSELLKNYLHAYQVTGQPFFRETAESIIGWVKDVLSHPDGGFYASQDADYSLDDDGDYFTWTQSELRAALDADEARAAELYYGVEAQGDMHHNPAKNVLHIASTVEEIAARTGRSVEELQPLLFRAREKMLRARSRRPTPQVDKTVYVSWNGMFISAFLEAYRILGRTDCREFALKTLDRLVANAYRPSHGFARRLGLGPDAADWLDGVLDDQVFMALALLAAFELTGEARYFRLAEETTRSVIEKYWDAEGGGFFDRRRDAQPLPGLEINRKPFQDSPTPAANSQAAILLTWLHSYTMNGEYREKAESTLEVFGGLAETYGLFAASYGLAALLHARQPIQVVIVGRPDDARAAELEAAANMVYRFGKAVLRFSPQKAEEGLPAGLAATLPHLDASDPLRQARAIICVNSACLPPMETAAELQKAILAAR